MKPLHRRLQRGLVWLALAALLSGCAALLGPRTIEVSQEQLQQHIAARFPYHNRFLELLDIGVSAPRVTLLPDSNRIATVIDVSASDRFLRSALRGTLALDYGVRYEPSDHTLRLAQVRVEGFRIDGAPAAVQGQLNRIGALIAEQLLYDQVVHRLDANDVQALQRRGYRPGEVKITSRGIALTLEPAK
jgi:hypothetical protein